VKQIVVASTNPVKIQAALNGFRQLFASEQFEARGISVPSGVSAQPMSNAETLQGALHRVEAARRATPDADYWIGIEGGCEDSAEGMTVFAWVVALDGVGKIGKSRTATFFLPQEVSELVRQGMELGDADDAVFGRKNSKQQNGSVGLLTEDVITRLTYYEQAVILALIPFKNAHFRWRMNSEH
jgi:inosine/xanthosine triphosphatase